MSSRFPKLSSKSALLLGARLAPDWTGRLAWAIFRTPIGASRPTPVQAEVLAQAKSWTSNFEGKTLKVYRWPGTGPTILMVHGWAGRAHVFGELIPSLLERGFSVVSYDAPAHNGNGGKTEMLEFSRALSQVFQEVGPVSGLVGHSFGAMTSAFTAPKLAGLKALALLGAPDTLEYVLQRAQSKLHVPSEVMAYIYNRIEKVSGIPVCEHSSSLYLRDWPGSLLMLHDSKDKEIPLLIASNMAKRKNAELVVTHGYGHHRILNSPEAAVALADFMERKLLDQCPKV